MGGRLVCCGLATLDVVQVVERVPAPDQKVVAESLSVTFGGPAANAAATAAALGVPTLLVTSVGTGPVADLVRAGLRDAGVEVLDLAASAPASPAVSSVLVTRSTGERAVVSVNATGTADLSVAAASVVQEALAGATALLVDGHHLGAAVVLARAARTAGVPVLLDGGSWKEGLDELLALVDHAVLSRDFALPAGTAAGTRDVLAAVADLGPSFVARSAGAGPVQTLTRVDEDVRRVLLPPVVAAEDVVDTLGAGDVLHGATAAALAAGAPIEAALAAGVARASASVRHPGALGWVSAL